MTLSERWCKGTLYYQSQVMDAARILITGWQDRKPSQLSGTWSSIHIRLSSALKIRRWRHRPNEAAKLGMCSNSKLNIRGQNKECCCTGIMRWLWSWTLDVQHKCSLRDTTVPYYWESTSGHADRTWSALGPHTMETTAGQISKSTLCRQELQQKFWRHTICLH